MLQLVSVLHFIIALTLQTETYEGDSARSHGKASFYHDKFQGRLTSNGEVYDKNDFTAAHRTLPFNSIVHVYNKKNGKSVIVRINDRGPFRRSRIIDLSRSAAEKIEMVPFGIVPVTISLMTLLDNVPLTDSSFVKDEVWDLYGDKTELKKSAVLVWITENWKHAFYVAGKLSLENKLENVVVRIAGPSYDRTYEIIVSSIKDKTEEASLIQELKKQGFKRTHSLSLH